MRLISVIVSLLCVTSIAQADPPRLLPEYTPCVYERQRYACYTMDQQVQLNLLEAQAQSWKRQLDLRLEIEKLFERNNNNLLSVTLQFEEIRFKRDQHVHALEERLMEEIELKNKYKAKARIRWGWPLAIGGGLTLIASGAIAGIWLLR